MIVGSNPATAIFFNFDIQRISIAIMEKWVSGSLEMKRRKTMKIYIITWKNGTPVKHQNAFVNRGHAEERLRLLEKVVFGSHKGLRIKEFVVADPGDI